MNNDLISRSELKKAFNWWWGCDDIPSSVVKDLIDDASTAETTKAEHKAYNEGFKDGVDQGIKLSASQKGECITKMKLINADDLKEYAQKLLVGERINTYFGINLYKMFEEIIDNAPTVAVNCKDCDGYEVGYSAGLKDAERPQDDIFPMKIVAGKCPIEAGGNCPLKSQGEWVPVSKKLPDVVRRYLVYTKYNEMMTDFFTGDKFMQGDDIIAWMPLPEPYKEGEKNETDN